MYKCYSICNQGGINTMTLPSRTIWRYSRFLPHSLQEVETVALSDKKERVRTANPYLIVKQKAFGVELGTLLEFHLCIHIFLPVYRVADHSSINCHLLLEGYNAGFLMGEKKMHLIIFSKGAYGCAQQAMSCLEFTIIRLLAIASILLKPPSFAASH